MVACLWSVSSMSPENCYAILLLVWLLVRSCTFSSLWASPHFLLIDIFFPVLSYRCSFSHFYHLSFSSVIFYHFFPIYPPIKALLEEYICHPGIFFPQDLYYALYHYFDAPCPTTHFSIYCSPKVCLSLTQKQKQPQLPCHHDRCMCLVRVYVHTVKKYVMFVKLAASWAMNPCRGKAKPWSISPEIFKRQLNFSVTLNQFQKQS